MPAKVKVTGVEAVKRKIRRVSRIGIWSAQFGVKGRRVPWRFKRPGGSKALKSKDRQTYKVISEEQQRFDNREILEFVLRRRMKTYPVFVLATERNKISKVWLSGINRFLAGDKGALAKSARTISIMFLSLVRKHMEDGKTFRGRPTTKTRLIRTISIYRANHGNTNYTRGTGKDRARQSGYGVDTGKLYDSMVAGFKRVR